MQKSNCGSPDSSLSAYDGSRDSLKAEDEPTYTIGELAKKFEITLRTLRFYEIQGLLSPNRQGRRRRYGRTDVDRLAAILWAKKLGFTINEIRRMLAEQGGEAARQELKLSREKCLAQINRLMRELEDITKALAELHRIYSSL